MQSSVNIRPQWFPQQRLRIDQAANILGRAPRTVRYYIQTGSLQRCNGFVNAEEVYALKRRLEEYYTKPFQPGSRSRGRKAQ
jgi:hypothetical protein